MKGILYHVLLFAVFAIVFSSLTGCGSGTGTNTNVRAANTNANGAQPVDTKASEYPPFQASLAEGEIELLDGSKTKISDHKGKVLLVNLWATWCGPCRGEMPHLIAMQNQYGDKGFEVIGLDIGDGEGGPEPNDAIKKFGEKMQLNYELGKIKGDMIKQFNQLSKFDAIPQSYLIDREGRLRGVFTSGGPSVIEKMKSEVAKVVSEN